MNTQHNNPLLDIADELNNGEKSLKDLYYDQLLADMLAFEEEDFADVEKDAEFYTESADNQDEFKFVSFDFTKAVMAQVRQVEQEKHQASAQAPAKTATAQVANYAPRANKGATAFFSEQADDVAASAPAASATAGAAAKEDSSLMNRTNLMTILIAFLATLLAVFTFNNLNSSSEGGFSTVAKVEQATPAQVAQAPAKPAQQPAVAPTTQPQQQVLTAQTSNALNAQLLQSYRPVPISEGVKLVSLQVARTNPAANLTLKKDQVKNINLLLLSYEIQKRLVNK